MTPGAARHRSVVLFTAVLIAVLAGASAIEFVRLSVSDLQLIDTDGYMRAVRVLALVDGHTGWFDHTVARANWPWGHPIHWSRAVDTAAGLLAKLLKVGLSTREAVYWAAISLSPLTRLALGLTVGWWVRSVTEGDAWMLVAATVPFHPVVAEYTTLGRFDHHGLLLLAFALLMGSAWRSLDDVLAVRRFASLAGIASGAGLWLGIEALLMIGLVIGSMALAWLLGEMRAAPAARRILGTTVVTSGLVLVIEHGSRLFESQPDRFSFIHWVGLVAAYVAARFVTTRPHEFAAPAPRIRALFVAAIFTALILWIIDPSVYGGAFQIPEDIEIRWLSRVAELQPLWPVGPGPSVALRALALPVVAVLIGFVTIRGLANRRSHRQYAWMMQMVVLITFVGLAISAYRFSPFAELAAMPFLARGIDGLASRVGEKALPRVVSAALVVAGLIAPGYALYTQQGAHAPACDVSALLDDVPDEIAADPVVILAAMDWGPEMLWRSDASVIASPYHGNVDGIRAWFSAMESVGSTARREVFEPRAVDVLLICPEYDDALLADLAPDSLYREILRGSQPAWLEELPTNSGFSAFISTPKSRVNVAPPS